MILAVGDSFTFGDRVSDHETWPAQLERLTGRQVLNAGVFGYGVDQAYLRAVALLETYDTDLVVLALIKALFMTVWCPDSRSVESNCGIPRG